MGLARRARRRWDEVNATTSRHDPAMRSTEHGGVDRPDRGRRDVRGLPRGRGRGHGRSRRADGRCSTRTVAGRRRGPRPDGPAHGRSPPRGRRLRRLRRQPGGPRRSRRTRRPGRPVRDDGRPGQPTPCRTGRQLRDLGRHVLKDVPRPERLFQLDIAGLPNDFPPLRTATRAGRQPARSTDHRSSAVTSDLQRPRGARRRTRG